MKMSATQVRQELSRRAEKINLFFATPPAIFAGAPDRLKKAMLYSLNAGGKRIRPCLCMACASLCGLEEDAVLPFAAAIEMIHTYSLIHDDLPAMDNDDLRRGKPSNHKAFDEATAILAGDGLLTDAFALCGGMDLPSAVILPALTELAQAAGSSGMVGGQMLDMIYTGAEKISLQNLSEMQAMKTGAIIRASCLCGAMLANAEPEKLQRIGEYGASLGKAFQIADDILDVVGDTQTLGKPQGSDAAAGKNTWPSIAGIAASQHEAQKEAARAVGALEPFSGPEADFLRALVKYVITRMA